MVREIARQTYRSANTQLGVAKRVAGDIGYCLGLGPKSATREVAGSAFCPLTRITPPAIVCWIDRSGVRIARRALARATVGHPVLIHPRHALARSPLDGDGISDPDRHQIVADLERPAIGRARSRDQLVQRRLRY